MSVDVDENPDLVKQLGLAGIPTALFLRDGKVVDTLNGADPVAMNAKGEALFFPQGRLSR
jgi:thioredoxin 2